MRTLVLPDQTIELEAIVEDDFSTDGGNWLAEGGAEVVWRDGRLFMDARDNGREHPYLTLWNKEYFEGDCVIEYTWRVEEGDGSTNLNFFVYATHIDGGSIIETTAERTGDYPEYHQFNNYIYTYLTATPEAEEEEKTRIRFRKDPGFRLMVEEARPAFEKGVDRDFVVAIQGGRMRYYAGGELIIDYTDNDKPHRKGLHGFRTWHSFVSAKMFRVSRFV